MAIKKVWIEEGCTACNLCVDTCPKVFDLPNDTAVVNDCLYDVLFTNHIHSLLFY
ncbi:MAG: ferredoxin [Bacteroidota bacterium]|nr:ferredoxin [Bacteroidota bacterium]